MQKHNRLSQNTEEVRAVKTVVLIMRRASLAQGLMAKVQHDPGFQLCYEPADAYYTDAVKWAVKNGVTSGTGAATFEPNADCSRAQIVTFLYRCLSE